jgi:hypothetical protein
MDVRVVESNINIQKITGGVYSSPGITYTIK